MKTFKGWQKSGLNLDKYLTEPCRIDEELELYLGEIVAPQYCGNNLTQLGEPEFKKEGVYFYMTAYNFEGKSYYLGILPEFKQ